MKIKHLLKNSLLGLAIVAGLTASAQQETIIHRCATDEATEDTYKRDPKAKERREKVRDILQKEYLANEANITANKTSAPPVYTVPVVFHILHKGGVENVPDANCIAALNWVNLDFARANFDANNTAAPFNASYIDSEIKFMIAKKDPNGNCTTGIIHHVDAATTWSQSTHALKSVHTWDPTKYLNIYIVSFIVPTSTVAGGGFIVGYTNYPGVHPTGSDEDIIVYRYDYLTGGDNARSLTHEIGHWLNLPHIWGSTNAPNVACGDDGISDTPVTMGHEFSCPSSSINPCVQTNTVYNNLDNVHNIMNYANCTYNFTTGQTTSMRTTLVSATGGRNNLPTGANLIATDVNGATACAPFADFMSIAVNGYTVCAGQSINLFKDVSYGAPIISRIWTATNGATITTPTASQTIIWFPTPGISVVSYSVTGAAGGSIASRTITVLNGAATATSIIESFEGAGVPPNWSVENPNGVAWVQTSLASLDGTFSFYLDGAISSSGSEDILNMPIMDFLTYPTATLRFSYAYRQKTAVHADIFKVQLSNDCGGTWKDVFAPSASALALGSGGVGTSNFVPTISEWKTQDVSGHPNYGSFVGSSSVLGRFYFKEATGGFGNRIYIDSVNLVAAPPIGVNELTRHLQLTLSPNPTNSSASLGFILSSSAKVKVTVMDVTGKVVSPEKAYDLNPGSHSITVNENGVLSKGIYMVSLEYNGTKMARKLIIE